MADVSEQRFRQLIGGRRNPNADPIPRAEKRSVESGAAGRGSGKRVEVEPSGEAQRLVEGWLRLGGSRNAGAQGREEEEEGEEDEAVPWNPKGRPARLGLGAKFLPHSHVAASMLSVERRLRDKLNVGRGVGDSFPSGSADAHLQFGGGGSRSTWSKPHSGGSRSLAGRAMARGQEGKVEQTTSRRRTDEHKGGSEAEEEEEDMEGSRASVFAKKAKFQAMDVGMDMVVGAKKGNKKKKKKKGC